MPEQGLLLIVSGPSGVGKGAVMALLLANNPNLVCSVSTTTRAPRLGERHGVNYYFVSREEFAAAIREGEFLEWAEVYGNYYGTRRSAALEQLCRGKDLILEIDTQGARQIKAACPSSISIFIKPPSFAELERRIVSRGSENAESLARRLSAAQEEISRSGEYDYVVVNDELERAAAELESIIRAEKARRSS
ncbi:MAG: guanylate kinase [Clostridiales bacterium]|nr:guanylate kinase [Clostridiales bacterium]